MPAFKNILFPVDFSEQCASMGTFVLSLANQLDAKLTFLHAFETPVALYGGMDVYSAVLDVPAIKRDIGKRLDTWLSSPSRKPVTVVEEGHPADCIVSFAAKHNIDLIVMPTHGYGPFRRFLLGSVTAKVLHDAHCPVWTSAHTGDPSVTQYTGIRNMICAIDSVPESVVLIRYADELARAFSSKLRLVHAIGNPFPPEAYALPERYAGMDFRHFLHQVARDEIEKMQQEAGTEVPVDIEESSVSQVVSDVARRTAADLVIIGRGRLHGALGRLRSNTYAIIRDSPCPVLSV